MVLPRVGLCTDRACSGRRVTRPDATEVRTHLQAVGRWDAVTFRGHPIPSGAKWLSPLANRKGQQVCQERLGGIKIVLESPRTDEPPSWSGMGRSYRRRSSARAPQRTTTPQWRFRRFSEALRSDWPREDLFAPRFKARAMDLYRFSEGRPLAVAELAIGTETFRK